MDIRITDRLEKRTIGDFLRNELKLSRSQISSLKNKEKGILLNGVHATVRAVLNNGDLLSVFVEDCSGDINENIIPKKLDLDILFEDDDIIVVNKPYGMPTHPSHGHFEDTLANGLAYYYSIQDRPFVFRAITRLDCDTSGIVLIAKNKRSANVLSLQMKNHEIEKKYIAICHGTLEDKCGEIETYIKREKESIITRVVCGKDDGGDYACTKYSLISSSENSAIYSVSPKTGRTHQIRVHFSFSGCPLYGDGIYGKIQDGFNRQALHAYYLEFKHPTSGETVSYLAPVPDDMELLIKKLGLQINYDKNQRLY